MVQVRDDGGLGHLSSSAVGENGRVSYIVRMGVV